VLKLVEFEKGEVLSDPLRPLSQFYMIVKGSVSIYHLTEDGSIRYISKAANGTLLGDMEFSGAGN
jgi:CRP-like cAMP-binding protein